MTFTKIIFLDIDGPFCNYRSSVAHNLLLKDFIDPIALKLLLNILEKDAKIGLVVSSTWRIHDDCMDKLAASGFPIERFHIDWKTIRLPSAHRGSEVQEWLDRHPEVIQFCCIDDDSDYFENQNLIKTSNYDGMSFQNYLDILDIFDLG